MSDTSIEIRGLSKVFGGKVRAVDGLEMVVPRGVVYGLIGRNGAGKTTTLRMLMGLLRPDAGHAHVLGMDVRTADPSQRARVAYVSQAQQLYSWMTLEELGHYMARFYPHSESGHLRRLAQRFEVPADRPIGVMSGGEQRKAAIVLALAARTEVLILDEPAGGLDPIARRQLVDTIVDLATDGGTSILFSTHIITDLERVAEYVGIMDRGRMVNQGRLEDLHTSTRRVQVIFPGDSPPAGFTVPGAVRSHTAGSVVTALVRLEDEGQLDTVRQLAGVRVQVFPLGLEEAFIDLLGPEMAEELEEVLP
jgi:ABC-2 type transport system ATP-binding protein